MDALRTQPREDAHGVFQGPEGQMGHQEASTEQQGQSTGRHRGDPVQLGGSSPKNGSFSLPELVQDFSEPGPEPGGSEQGVLGGPGVLLVGMGTKGTRKCPQIYK